jgi:hypothetical protein
VASRADSPAMKQFLLGLSISLAFILGCVTAAAVTSHAQADAAPAVSAGECIAVNLDYVAWHEVEKGKLPQRLHVPAGWHPVGGGGSQTGPTVVLCQGTTPQ